ATRIAAKTLAPVDVPANKASSFARRCVIFFASSVEIEMISSARPSAQMGGMKPGPFDLSCSRLDFGSQA
ncbi:MAG: hypothetical protein AAF485_23090, partial [Chloroflexota bacterium]